jgi:ribosomal protein S18 acetylase RimI-like enzyme
MVTINTLENTSIESILKTFNLAFSDYSIPFKLTLESLESKLKNDNIKLEYSVGAFENGKLIAFVLHGYGTCNNRQLIYNSGTGVIPSKRGQKLTAKLYAYIIPRLRSAAIESVILEVIATNTAAIKSYTTIGFKTTRHLNCYKGTVHKTSVSSSYQVSELKLYDWDELTSFWDFTPSWQNNINAVENSKKETVAFSIHDKGNLIGYIIFNPKSNRVQQFAVDKASRNLGVGYYLFNHIKDNYSSEISLINIESTAQTTLSFLENNGMQLSLVQYEMALTI